LFQDGLVSGAVLFVCSCASLGGTALCQKQEARGYDVDVERCSILAKKQQRAIDASKGALLRP
jgi:hypothetical protein